ncbi:unnamed protein product [Aureobasidium pullulans]|uniref:mRNA N(6)-methyladenine demethylase n=1 Tax=Aureobasidium pullulans TaxID=5580 RepID=A0A4S8SI61_AURPU|nr:hypothetical protein D6D28_05341 [Aureobasidium pullulans]THV99877.1 hypothetical protein D6D26_05856 [Aureobasidium pullulans]THX01038.1 hypothetical protein D6D18_04383 [Aureobasidium pullulans]THX88975.1 hypothetical protein D6D04_00086 [Aureobasidium pullulans]CAC9886588.1 unnamed protein product [Aureobasidium pullulans]
MLRGRRIASIQRTTNPRFSSHHGLFSRRQGKGEQPQPRVMNAEQYWHYNKVKISDLENDESVVDWNKGLSEEQAKVLKPVSTISRSAIENACITFRNAALGTEGDESPLETEIEDVTVYEHADFPGLQIAPGILPPETQVLWISQIMHQYMANPKHKINLQTDFDIEYPVSEDSGETEAPTPSLFTYDPQSTHSTPKNPETQKSLNMAQMLSRKLRWLTLGEQYHWPTRSYPRNGPTTFPSDLSTLVSGLFPHIRPESGVCLLYGQKDYMPVHRDVSELCERALASFSFGCDGIFVIARGEGELEEGEDPKKRTVAIRVRSGDCVHLDNETRWAWHAMPRTIPGSCPQWLAEWPAVKGDAAKRVSEKERKAYQRWKGFMGAKRLNVSVRQVWD